MSTPYQAYNPHNPYARPAPHVRLNSGQTNPVIDTYTDRPGPPPRRDSSSRTLIPPGRPSTSPLRINAPLPGAYITPGPSTAEWNESTDRLLPPSATPRTLRPRDRQSPGRSIASRRSSRRSSWSSSADGGRTPNPFADSRAPSTTGSDDEEDLNTQTVSEKYNILPSAGLLLYPEDVEKDDYLHNPGPNDDKIDHNIFTKRGLTNVGALALLTGGLLVLFIGFPVLTYIQKSTASTDICRSNQDCLNSKAPLLKNIRRGLIDPTTPTSAQQKTGVDGSVMKLVFSDEFNTDGRTFYPGDDPYFTAVDIWYGVTQDNEWYDPDAITTKNGALEIRFDAFQNHLLNFRSGMLQSWNQLCFTGGHLEASISLPGNGQTSGFWPGFWAMGNLGRPGYAATTDGMWPYSYDDVCDAGITKNQSQTDGLSYLPGMRLPACTCIDEDHPTPGKSRSSPEIDVIEATVAPLNGADGVGTVSQSLQLAPFDIWYAPDYEYQQIYDPTITTANAYRGGPYQQAMSGLSNLNNDWYNGNAYQTYALEYTPGSSGAVTWFVGPEKTWTLDARSIRTNGNVGARVIPKEPMAMVMNFGMSDTFAPLNWTGLAPLLPATMRFDYVRIYQKDGENSVTCDPPGMETTSYIANHLDVYTNPNLTRWSDTSHAWPRNALVDGCSAEVSGVTVQGPS